ncbi:TBC1 domain, member 5 [Branchiostoma belcheri]|nr:TBC1 domain, member 5 [Branchiostoma belcheri]
MASMFPQFPNGRFRKRPTWPRLVADIGENLCPYPLSEGASAPTVQFLPVPHAQNIPRGAHTIEAKHANNSQGPAVQRPESMIEYYAVAYLNPKTGVGTAKEHKNTASAVQQSTESGHSDSPRGGFEDGNEFRRLPVKQSPSVSKFFDSDHVSSDVANNQDDAAASLRFSATPMRAVVEAKVSYQNIPQCQGGSKRNRESKERWHPRMSHLTAQELPPTDTTIPPHFYQNTGVGSGSLRSGAWQKRERRKVRFNSAESDICNQMDSALANQPKLGATTKSQGDPITLTPRGDNILQPLARAPACLQGNHMRESALGAAIPDELEETARRQFAVNEATTVTSASQIQFSALTSAQAIASCLQPNPMYTPSSRTPEMQRTHSVGSRRGRAKANRCTGYFNRRRLIMISIAVAVCVGILVVTIPTVLNFLVSTGRTNTKVEGLEMGWNNSIEDNSTKPPAFMTSLPPNDVTTSTPADWLTSSWKSAVTSTHQREATKSGVAMSGSDSKTTVPIASKQTLTPFAHKQADGTEALVYADPALNRVKCTNESYHDCANWEVVRYGGPEERSSKCYRLSTDNTSSIGQLCVKYVHSSPYSRQTCWNRVECCSTYKTETMDDRLMISNPVFQGQEDSIEDNLDQENSSEPPTPVTHSYSDEWKRLFMSPDYIRTVCQAALRGELRSCRFRSVCWRLFLEVMPESQSDWTYKVKQWRSMYNDIRDRHIVNPRQKAQELDLAISNPLSQEEESPWNQFFKDEELREMISQDVRRTFPEIEFFQKKELREMMINILFCYARENVRLGYRQGMHELLAPVIFVLHCDHQAFLHALEISTTPDIARLVLDPAYLENDAYAMFCQIMETVEPWYSHLCVETPPASQNHDIAMQVPFSNPEDSAPSPAIVTKLTRVQDLILKKHDHTLHAHLRRLQIPPQVYGIRWIRLLFGREFPLQDLLFLWDAIFSDGISFGLVDYIFVAMLLYIKNLLVSGDYQTCMTTLMRYPPMGDVHFLVNKALYLRDPKNYPRPVNYEYHYGHQMKLTSDPSNGSQSQQQRGQRAKSMQNVGSKVTAGWSTLTRKMQKPKGGEVRKRTMKKADSEPETAVVAADWFSSSSEDSELFRSPRHVPSDLERSRVKGESPSHHPGFSHPLEDELEDLKASSSSSSRAAAKMEPLQDMAKSPQAAKDPLLGNTTSSRTHTRAKVKASLKEETDKLQKKTGALQSKLHDMEAMCKYCSSKMDAHISHLQDNMLQEDLKHEDEVFLALAGLKQVRDILKGTLKFSANILESEEIVINDNYFTKETLHDQEETKLDEENVDTSETDSLSNYLSQTESKDSISTNLSETQSRESFNAAVLDKVDPPPQEMLDYHNKEATLQSSTTSEESSKCKDAQDVKENVLKDEENTEVAGFEERTGDNAAKDAGENKERKRSISQEFEFVNAEEAVSGSDNTMGTEHCEKESS